MNNGGDGSSTDDEDDRMNTRLDQFTDQKYINLETFRANGEAVRTPLWFVQDGLDGKIYVRTTSGSGKVKRIHRNQQVSIMACGQSGEPLGTWVPAQAYERIETLTAERVRELLFQKYGDMVAWFEDQTRAKGLEYTVLQIEIGE
jgi:PPOX class probable F420-dependent enzyme